MAPPGSSTSPRSAPSCPGPATPPTAPPRPTWSGWTDGDTDTITAAQAAIHSAARGLLARPRAARGVTTGIFTADLRNNFAVRSRVQGFELPVNSRPQFQLVSIDTATGS